MIIAISVMSIILQFIIGYETGSLVASALSYSTEKGAAFSAAFFILLCVLGRYLLDRMLAKNKRLTAFSPMVIEIAAYVVCTILLVIILELYAEETFSVTLAVTMMVVILSMLYEKDAYLKGEVKNGEENEDSDGGAGEDDDGDGNPRVESEADAGGNSDDDGNADTNAVTVDGVDVDGSVDANGENVSIAEALKIAESINEPDDVDVDDENPTDENSGESSDEADSEATYAAENEVTDTLITDKVVAFSTSSGSEDESEEYEIERRRSSIRSRIISAEFIKIFMYIASILFGAIVLGDIQSKKFGVMYFLIIVLVAVLAVILRALNSGMNLIIEAEKEAEREKEIEAESIEEVDSKQPEKAEKTEKAERKIRLVGYFVIITMFTVFICFKSILIGLVYLLGALIVKMIIPWIFDNFGVGGTKVVNIRKDTVSRLVARFFTLIILMLAVWQLSYGALWEVDFLTIIAISIGSADILFAQNRVS